MNTLCSSTDFENGSLVKTCKSSYAYVEKYRQQINIVNPTFSDEYKNQILSVL